MTRRPTNPARRKRRTAACAVLLSLLLVALLLVLGFPFLTARGALAAIREQYAFGPREITARFGPQQEDMPPLWYYAVRDGDWFAWYSVERDGLFWRPGVLTTAHLDGETSLAILTSPVFGGRSQESMMVSGGLGVTVVKVDYLSGFDLPPRLRTAHQEAPEDQCFFFALEDPYHGLSLRASPSAYFRVRYYGTNGKLLYKSPHPVRWLERPILDPHLKVVTP